MSHSITSNSVLAKRPPILLRWAAFSFLCLALLLPQRVARAHPVDMYAQELFVVLMQDGVSIDWEITPGTLLADTVWAAADGNRDSLVSSQEARAWVAPFVAQFSVTLDGLPLENLRVDGLHWPAAIGVLRTGEDSVQVQISAQWPAEMTGKRHLQIHNAYLEANSLDWFSLTGQGLSFDTPLQTNGQLETDIYAPASASALTSWNSGLPDLAGISGALSGLADSPQNGGPATAVSALVGLVKTQELSPLFLLGALLLSLALGSLHALTPGHGKALVAAYLVGSRGRSRDAVFLGLVVTLTHTGSVVLLGLLTLLASQYILPGQIAPWLEIVSGLLVVVFGLNLFFQRRQVLFDWWAARRARRAAKNRLNQKTSFSLQSASLARSPAGFGLLHTPACETHSHSHLPTGAVTWKSLLALGVSGGLVPCPDAIAILLVAVAINRILFGMLLILAFSAGLALVLIAIGLAMLQGLRLVARNTRSDLLNRFSRYAPLVSALVVSGLGVGLTFSAAHALAFTSAQAAGPVFEIERASLLYLFPDAKGKHQLTRQPLAGGAAIPYTDEPDSVAGYSVSPDGKTIVYVVFRANGESLLRAVDADGSRPRLLLDCKRAQCGGPVWYPDGRRLVYQRADYADDYSLPRFSLWWLDLASGETRPVFQDGAFASYAPAFSPDGQWLSYKSPVNNTLQLYNLLDGRVVSIPIPLVSGDSQMWSPNADALLFWDAASAQEGAALHVKRYDLTSGLKTDLGGEPTQVDYAAAWSPDGAWVVINRELPAAAQSKRGDQVWIMRPDGSHARLLLGEAEASYSDMTWTPDGQSLVYTRYSYLNLGQSEIWMVDIETGAKTKLVSGGIAPVVLP